MFGCTPEPVATALMMPVEPIVSDDWYSEEETVAPPPGQIDRSGIALSYRLITGINCVQKVESAAGGKIDGVTIRIQPHRIGDGIGDI